MKKIIKLLTEENEWEVEDMAYDVYRASFKKEEQDPYGFYFKIEYYVPSANIAYIKDVFPSSLMKERRSRDQI